MKNIRKFLCLALALIMVLSLAACGSKSDDAQDNNDDAQQTPASLSRAAPSSMRSKSPSRP